MVPAAFIWRRSAAKFSDSAIASPAQASPAEINQSCGECHSQHFLAMPASRTAPDWMRFPGSTLPWSRCYAESGGALSCVTCHDPHTQCRDRTGLLRGEVPVVPRSAAPSAKAGAGSPSTKPKRRSDPPVRSTPAATASSATCPRFDTTGSTVPLPITTSGSTLTRPRERSQAQSSGPGLRRIGGLGLWLARAQVSGGVVAISVGAATSVGGLGRSRPQWQRPSRR